MQANKGDNNTPPPEEDADPEDTARWDSWEDKKGMPKDQAKAALVKLVDPLLPEAQRCFYKDGEKAKRLSRIPLNENEQDQNDLAMVS